MLPAKCAGRMGEQMIKSMTGFGRCEICEDNRKFTVEMKSVNHRYLDVNLKMPKKLNFFEAAIRNLLKEYIQRGKVDVFITYEDLGQEKVSIRYNKDVAAKYLVYLRQMSADFGLRGNEKIEEAIAGLQQEPTQEMLAHALTVVRRRMKENGQLIVAVEPPAGGGQLLLQTVKTSDSKLWWAAFTGFEEELRGSDRVKSTFLADMGQLFVTALQADGVEGIILNPWNRTLMLEKELIRIILGQQG